MCTIAGYNGSKRAAPILIDMMRKMVGLDSGFYTGIATFHEGRIYCAKVTGDLEHLLSTTDAAALPGTMGFIHSRTPANVKSDFVEVGHPFTAELNGEIHTALIMNGCNGFFEGKVDIASIVRSLEEKGYTIKSKHPTVGVTLMPDGTRVHGTDVRCQLTSSKIAEGASAPYAMQEALSEMPSESVGLLLSVTEPDAICFTRQVMSMHVAFCDHGAYMATAPLAIPGDAGNYTLLPTMSYGRIFSNRFEAAPIVHPGATVAPITPQVMAKAYEYIEQKLKEPMPFVRIGWADVLKDLYPEADCTQRGTVAYQVISELYRQGRLRMETRYQEGQTEHLRAPVFYLSLP